MKNRFLFLGIIFSLISCTSQKEEKIVELDSIHRYYKALAKEIPSDLFNTCAKQNSLRGLLDKSYITPKIHSSIMGVWGPYQNTCQIVENELGTILNYNLYKIVDKGIVYHFYYSLDTEKGEKAILKLVLNKEYGLSEFHIYTYTNEKYNNILFPKE